MRNKRKGILMASAILGSAAIVSTGFAAWVVSTNVTETATGNIEVDTVDDKRIEFVEKPTFVDEDSTVSFGAPASQNIANAWLTNEGPTVGEDLDVTFKFKVRWTDSAKNTAGDDIVLYYKQEIFNGNSLADFATLNSTTYNAENLTLLAVTDNDPITLTVTGGTLNKTAGTITCEPNTEVTVDIAFAWGTAFGNMNPYNYFNVKKSGNNGYYVGDTNGVVTNDEISEAIRRLNLISTNIDPLSFKYTLSNKSFTA